MNKDVDFVESMANGINAMAVRRYLSTFGPRRYSRRVTYWQWREYDMPGFVGIALTRSGVIALRSILKSRYGWSDGDFRRENP